MGFKQIVSTERLDAIYRFLNVFDSKSYLVIVHF